MWIVQHETQLLDEDINTFFFRSCSWRRRKSPSYFQFISAILTSLRSRACLRPFASKQLGSREKEKYYCNGTFHPSDIFDPEAFVENIRCRYLLYILCGGIKFSPELWNKISSKARNLGISKFIANKSEKKSQTKIGASYKEFRLKKITVKKEK